MNAEPPLDLAALLDELARHETEIAGWNAEERKTVESLRSVIERLHGEALRRLVKALKSDSGALPALKGATADEFVYAVLRRHGLLRPSLNERVEGALESVRPLLASHGGNVELVSVGESSIEVRFVGACDGCAASLLTFHSGVKKAVQEACPEITSVVQVKGSETYNTDYISPFSLGSEGSWHAACASVSLVDQEAHARTVAGERVLLYRNGASVICFRDACAHMGLALAGGSIDEGVLTCPHHKFRFDLANGRCRDAPDLHLTQYAVRVSDGLVEIKFAS